MRPLRRLFIFALALLILLFCTACVPESLNPDASPSDEVTGNASGNGGGGANGFTTGPPQNGGGHDNAQGGATSPTDPATTTEPPTQTPQESPPATGTSPGLPSVTPDPSAPPSTSPSPPTSTSPPPSPSPGEPGGPGETGGSGEPGGPSPTPPPDDGPVILTITGSGVNSETTWTLGQLQALSDGYRLYTFSTTNNWPTFSHIDGRGVSLRYLLQQAGMTGSAASFKFTATDGYYFTLTYDQLFGIQYSYSNHSSSGSSGATVIEPIIAWEWGKPGGMNPEDIRSLVGQRGPMDVNTAASVRNLCQIEVLTTSAGAWASPGASIADGASVPAGTELHLTHGNMDSLCIYYTLDGSEPDYNSAVYNYSASYFQPHLIVPFILTEDTTIKAFAAGFGKDPSPVVSFTFIVS